MILRADGKEIQVHGRPTFYTVAKELYGKDAKKYLVAFENGRLRELFKYPREGAEIRFLTAEDKIGFEVYRRSVVMLFQAALRKCYGSKIRSAILHFTIGPVEGDVKCDSALAEEVSAEMRRIIAEECPFEKRAIPTSDAIRLFHEKGMHDKERLFRTRIASRVNIYSLDGYEDYYYGFMAHDASFLQLFELIPYSDGLILNLPKQSDPYVLPEITYSEKLFEAQIQGELWAGQQGIASVGDLNDKIIRGDVLNTVLTAEALQESRISDIAEMIASREKVKFVMIAGPSSSGKTTFSQRLCIQLISHGLKPHYIGVDNYFMNREDMVPGPDGKVDFESLSAVDVDLFNKDMTALLNGETVAIPTFDFLQGRRIYGDEKLRLGEGELLVIEGIHCLNDQLSFSLPAESKFRIYISALTQLNIDEHNRVPSADGRLIRRIVRDNRTRGYNASMTIDQWDSVRRGEEKNIFPYQESADIFFNSAIPYEIAVLKVYVEPLLFQVTEDDPGYPEARRLLKFLDYFIAIPSTDVPKNSILREFIGGGCFRL